jgi:hypothetical protein
MKEIALLKVIFDEYDNFNDSYHIREFISRELTEFAIVSNEEFDLICKSLRYLNNKFQMKNNFYTKTILIEKPVQEEIIEFTIQAGLEEIKKSKEEEQKKREKQREKQDAINKKREETKLERKRKQLEKLKKELEDSNV